MLVKTSESEEKWCPTPIYNLESLLQKQIKQGSRFVHVRALRKNIAYNLQYLEFIHRCLEDLKLTSVIRKQNIKMFIIVGCSIIESLLKFLLIRKGEHSQTEWELETRIPGQGKNWREERIKIDSWIFKKLEKPKIKEMGFDSMLKKAESKKILGSDDNVYSKLKNLRKLRNKIHLQVVDDPTDTDWNAFHDVHLYAMAQIIYFVFTSNIFRPSAYEKGYFKYLENYLKVDIEAYGDSWISTDPNLEMIS